MGHYDDCREDPSKAKTKDQSVTKLTTLVPKSFPDMSNEATQALRYRYLVANPYAGAHLLTLLHKKKGTEEDFHNLLDRTIVSAIKAGAFEP